MIPETIIHHLIVSASHLSLFNAHYQPCMSATKRKSSTLLVSTLAPASLPTMPSLTSPSIILIWLISLLSSSLCLTPQTVHPLPVTSCGLDCSCYPPPPPSTSNLSICGAACCPPSSACADTSTSPPTCLSPVQCGLNSSASYSPCASALEASRSLAERYAGYLHADDLSSPALLQQLEASTFRDLTVIKLCNILRRHCHFAIAYCGGFCCS